MRKKLTKEDEAKANQIIADIAGSEKEYSIYQAYEKDLLKAERLIESNVRDYGIWMLVLWHLEKIRKVCSSQFPSYLSEALPPSKKESLLDPDDAGKEGKNQLLPPSPERALLPDKLKYEASTSDYNAFCEMWEDAVLDHISKNPLLNLVFPQEDLASVLEDTASKLLQTLRTKHELGNRITLPADTLYNLWTAPVRSWDPPPLHDEIKDNNNKDNTAKKKKIKVLNLKLQRETRLRKRAQQATGLALLDAEIAKAEREV